MPTFINAIKNCWSNSPKSSWYLTKVFSALHFSLTKFHLIYEQKKLDLMKMPPFLALTIMVKATLLEMMLYVLCCPNRPGLKVLGIIADVFAVTFTSVNTAGNFISYYYPTS